MIVLTVIFASFNGAETLPRTLEAFCALRNDNCPYKLVVVDNGSTDATPAILRSFQGKLPLTCLSEPRRGKNSALNHALAHIEGGIVVLTDDDVLPRPDWLMACKAAFDRHPEIDIVGGRIEPFWETDPPAWLLGAPLSQCYALTPPDVTEGPVSPRAVWGPNMALRTRIFAAGHRFDERVGPNGTPFYAMGSETEFMMRLHAHGYRAWHCPRAVVKHIIRKRQMTKRWVYGRAFRFGRGQARMARLMGSATAVLGSPRYMAGQMLRELQAMFGATLRGDAGQRFAALWEIAYLTGCVTERCQPHWIQPGSRRRA